MAGENISNKWDFKPWPGISYVVDPALPPDHFYRDLVTNVFHIGTGTDLQLRLFYLNLTHNDLQFLRSLHVSLGTKGSQ